MGRRQRPHRKPARPLRSRKRLAYRSLGQREQSPCELKGLIPQLACLRRLHVNGNEVVSAPVGSAMAGVVEEPDGAPACRLEMPRIGVDGTRKRAKSGVPFDRNVEVNLLEGLLATSNSSRLPSRNCGATAMPVMLPDGRARLV